MRKKQLTELSHLLTLFKDNYGQSHPITSDSIDRVLSTIDYIETTDPIHMSVDQLLNKLQELDEHLTDNTITVKEYIELRKPYNKRLREIVLPNLKNKHEDIFHVEDNKYIYLYEKPGYPLSDEDIDFLINNEAMVVTDKNGQKCYQIDKFSFDANRFHDHDHFIAKHFRLSFIDDRNTADEYVNFIDGYIPENEGGSVKSSHPQNA